MNTFYIIPSDKDAIHHGVLGMKWGIRRHQPYSVVPRQSGKTGKEIGDAAKHNKNRKNNKISNEFYDPDDFYDSEDRYKASKKAYDKTMDWFKKNEPEYLDDIIKRDGSNVDFAMYHNFRKLYEGFENEEWSKAEKEWRKRNRR